MAPMERAGDVDAYEMTYRVHEAIVPMKYNRIREAGRMNEALGILQDAREKLQRVGAADFHDLARYHSAESMLMAAEFTYKAALMREESRASTSARTSPQRDDENWFKWITIEQAEGGSEDLHHPHPRGDLPPATRPGEPMTSERRQGRDDDRKRKADRR